MGRLGLRNRRLGVALVLSSLLIFGILGVVGYLFQLPLTLSFIAKTPYGEELEASITVTARPNFLSYLSRRWSLAWRVGTTQRETVNIQVQIQVTGTNIASDATAYFYVEARDASDASKSYKEIDYSSNGTQISVGSAATFQTGDMTIDTHLSHIYGSAPTSDKTIDYYVWCRVEATGLISGRTLTVEIPVTKFDTVTYDYGTESTTTMQFYWDAWVYYGDDTNHGSDTKLHVGVGSYSGREYRAYLKIYLGSFPSSATQVKLKLYCTSTESVAVDCCKVTDDSWSETSITYSNAPAPGSVLSYHAVSSTGWHEWDVTNFVINEAAGDDYASFCLKPHSGTPTYKDVYFYSAEGTYKPYLEITSIDWSASWSWVNASTLSIMALQIVRDLLTVVALFMSIIVSWLTIQTYRRRRGRR